VICCSGDGLIHEALNSKIDLPVGALPGGTSNAYLFNMLKRRNLKVDLNSSIFMTMKGNVEQWEGLHIVGQTLNVKSFLFFNWGIIGNVDINSEMLRFLGELRYDVYGIYAILRYKQYRYFYVFFNCVEGKLFLNTQIKRNKN
jgi:sphingosine kinase